MTTQSVNPTSSPVQPKPHWRLQAQTPTDCDRILSAEALDFVADLVARFGKRIETLLERREQRQKRLDGGDSLAFLDDTQEIREGTWRVAPLPSDLLERRVEITGPTDRKMLINALNSGADVFMADLEDATSPTWENVVQGQRYLYEAVRGTLKFHDAARDKAYALNGETAVLMVRPRGLHLPEAHFVVDDTPAPGALFDFGLYFFHNANALIQKGTGPYFYLPKLESHHEAQLWNDVMAHAETRLGLPVGTAKTTVLVETLPASFELHEILHALKERAAGLNCGRWDYIFSAIKKNAQNPDWVLPDRGQVGMTQPFMRAYTQLVVQTCHRRGTMAIGGMAAQIPVKSDLEKNDAALAKVRADKEREAKDGHDGTWVAHPGLVGLAMEIFKAQLGTRQNQLEVMRDDVKVSARDLLTPPTGTRSEAGLRQNIRVGIQYLSAWLQGNGCVPIDYLMEDAATAEISRTQVWQWVRHQASLVDGRTVTPTLVRKIADEEVANLKAKSKANTANGDGAAVDAAHALFLDLAIAPRCAEFLTLPAYARIVSGPLSSRGDATGGSHDSP